MKNIERYAQEIYELLDETNGLGSTLICIYIQHHKQEPINVQLSTEKKEIIKWFNSCQVDDEYRLTYVEKLWLSENLIGKGVKYIIRTPINLFVIQEYSYEVYNLKKIGLKFCGLDVNQRFTLEELGVNYG